MSTSVPRKHVYRIIKLSSSAPQECPEDISKDDTGEDIGDHLPMPDYVARHITDLQRHNEYNKKRKVEEVVCQFCGRKMSNKNNLHKHQKTKICEERTPKNRIEKHPRKNIQEKEMSSSLTASNKQNNLSPPYIRVTLSALGVPPASAMPPASCVPNKSSSTPFNPDKSPSASFVPDKSPFTPCTPDKSPSAPYTPDDDVASKLKEALEKQKEQMNIDKENAVAYTKKHQWCGNCSTPSVYNCCWNTSYCSYSCQKEQWEQHQEKCENVKYRGISK